MKSWQELKHWVLHNDVTEQSAIAKSFGFVRIMSLDVIAGAIISALYVEKIWPTNLHWSVFFVLGFSVWLIYTFDHLYDAKTIEGTAQSPRHRFFQQHQGVITKVWVLSWLVVFYPLSQLPLQLWVSGSVLVLAVLILYALQIFLLKSKLFFKEFMVALVYSGAMVVGPISADAFTISAFGCFIFIQFFLLALGNLFLFSYFDHEEDLVDKRPSFAVKFGKANLRLLVLVLIAIQLLLLVLQMAEWQKLWVLYSMGLTLLIIALVPSFFTQKERYRIFGDLIFIFPLLYLLVM